MGEELSQSDPDGTDAPDEKGTGDNRPGCTNSRYEPERDIHETETAPGDRHTGSRRQRVTLR